MKKKRRGCCLVFGVLLFLVPGIFLVTGILPKETQEDRREEAFIEDLNRILQREKEQSGPEEQTQAKQNAEEQVQEEQNQQEPELVVTEEDNAFGYYYWTLDEQQQEVYLELLNGIYTMEENIPLHTDEKTGHRVIDMIFADHPELFWVEESYQYITYLNRIEIEPQYICSEEEKEQRMLQIEETVQEGLQSVPEGADTYETIKSLYTYVVETVDYDLDSSDNQNIYSSMVNRVSVCTGYARELQYLMQRAGVEALLTEGASNDGVLHAWVIGCIDGEYYHIDPTYGDSSYTEETEADSDPMPEVFQVDYTYLCCDTETILRDRTISEELEVPDCSSEQYLYYPLHDLYFASYSEEVQNSFRESLSQGQQYWEGQFGDAQSYQEMKDSLNQEIYTDLIFEYYPDLESVQLHMTYDEEMYVIRLWF